MYIKIGLMQRVFELSLYHSVFVHWDEVEFEPTRKKRIKNEASGR